MGNLEEARDYLGRYMQVASEGEKKQEMKQLLSRIELQLENDEEIKEAYDFIMLGDTAKAIEAAEKFISRNPKVWNGFFLHAWALRKEGRYAEAKNDLMKCLDFIEHIITSCTKVYPHEPRMMKGYDCQLVWWEQYEEMYELVRDSLISDPTLTPADLHSFYHEEYPLLGLDDFAMICNDAATELYYERNEDVA